MTFHILTLFPDMIKNGLYTSITGRAIEKGLLSVNAVNIRDYTEDKHKKVDDYPYGGGAGMVMQAQPVYDAWKSVTEHLSEPPRCIYLTPQGKTFNQQMAKEFAREKDLVFLCGHYEGIDERVLEEVVTDYISIGDYVLTGGELGAMVLIDAVSRFVPGVLSNEESSQFESLQDNLLEYPHYTRPEEWHGKKVPPVLLSGDHRKIEAWRHEQSVKRTKERRPDLLKNAVTVTCAFYALEESWRELIRQTTEEMTRYGNLLDVGRKKIRKQHNTFGSGDFLLFAVPSILPADSPVSAQEDFFQSFRGHNTPAALIYYGNPTEAEPQDSTLRIPADRLITSLQNQGFRILDTCQNPESSRERRLFLLRLREKIYQGIRKETDTDA